MLVWRRKLKLRKYWRQEAEGEVSSDAIRLVVFGDSISEGVGATQFRYSYVGRTALYIAEQTGRPVAIANCSMAGATSDDLLAFQLPKADIKNADIILLEIGTNDGHKPRGSQNNLRKNMEYLLANLPLEKTVISDLPFPKLRKKYQAIMTATLKDVKVARAYPSKTFEHLLPSLKLTAGDFWHPNNKGHELWFQAFKPGVDEVLKRQKLLKTKRK